MKPKKLYTATLIIAKAVIPAKAGIQKNTGFRVEPGMTNRIRLMSSCINRWLIGGVTFFLICVLPLSAFCQEASIKNVQVKGTSGAWKVSFFVENCFTVKMDEAIQSGIGTTFTFYLHVYQKRNWWKDRKVASVHFHHAIQYDPIRAEYRVTLQENGSTVATSDFEEAKGLMAKVESVDIVPSSPPKSQVPTQLRIKAELDTVKLPLHLEYLLFFVSLWNFETDWYIEPLPP